MTVSILKTSRASSTKTRIETNFQMSHVSHNGHQEQVPRKQGLKPDPPYELAFMGKNIKSKFHENKDWNHFIARFSARIRTSRASSTKTRIETRSYVGQKNTRIHQEQVPRKQGLKLGSISCGQADQETSRASSTKTRIETYGRWGGNPQRVRIKSKFHENKDWNSSTQPIKQRDCPHQEQVPRKQGLKHQLCEGGGNPQGASRASSTKTRIETKRLLRRSWLGRHQEQVPRKQGLKLDESQGLEMKLIDIKSKFHENKDWNNIMLNRRLGIWWTSRASSTKTRIETWLGTHCYSLGCSSRASSTKTRIETSVGTWDGTYNWPSRASSTKTRIETFSRAE